MKSIDFVKRVLQEAKVDLTKLGLTEINADTELPAEVEQAYANNLLTRERIEADPEINKTMQARAFKALNDGWDTDFNAFAEANMPKDVAEKIKTEKFTRNKWDLLRKNWTPAAKEDKVAAAEIASLHAQLKEKADLVAAKTKEYDNQLQGFQKNYLLTQKLAGAQWADAYTDLKEDLQDKFIKQLSNKSITLELTNGQLTPKRKAETGELLDVYEANVKVGLDDLITKELGKYFKQSAGSGNQPPIHKPIPGTPPKEGLTLAEMERAKVLEKFAKLKTQ